ncbi:right-handed parallel beta-helix repeat-containing protein [Candidatus Bipolaricaulota bacterium]|nr:right-handed parallel beta-helix repeat-containing protein [Candidatus Bipolaricaulota bacterium]
MLHREKAITFRLILSLLVITLALSTLTDPQAAASEEVTDDCTVTLTTDQSIQAAVDKVQRDSVVCLEEGRWEESILISKPLTLRGLGDKPEIYSTTPNTATVLATGGADLIKLQNLTISSYAKAYRPPIIHGESALEIVDCIISQEEESRESGLLLFTDRTSEQKVNLDLKITDTVFKNGRVGIYPTEDSIEALVQGSTINSDSTGLMAGKLRSDSDEEYEGPRVEVTVERSLFKGTSGKADEGKSGTGISLSDGARAEIVNTSISNFPGDGIQVIGAGKATVNKSIITDNGGNGIALKDLSEATVADSKITQNGGSGISISSWSRYAGRDLSGKVLYQSDLLPSNIEATIEGNKIANNSGHGVMISTDKCALKEETKKAVGFWGSVTGALNEITDNKKKNVCPSELSFLCSKEGGRYPRF